MSDTEILRRLRLEQAERAESLRLARSSAYAHSTREDDHVHGLAKAAAEEITRLRYLLDQAGVLNHSNN